MKNWSLKMYLFSKFSIIFYVKWKKIKKNRVKYKITKKFMLQILKYILKWKFLIVIT